MRTPLTIVAGLGVIITPWLNAQDSEPERVRVTHDAPQDLECEDQRVVGKDVHMPPQEEHVGGIRQAWVDALWSGLDDPEETDGARSARFAYDADSKEYVRLRRADRNDAQDQEKAELRAKLEAVIAQQRAESRDEATLEHLAAMKLLAQNHPHALHDAWVAQQDALRQRKDVEHEDGVAGAQIQWLKLQEERTRLMDESAHLKARAEQLRELADARAQIKIAGRVLDQDGLPVELARLERLRSIERAAAQEGSKPHTITFARPAQPVWPEKVKAPVVVWPTPECPPSGCTPPECPTPTWPAPSSTTYQPNSQAGGVTVIVENGDVHIYNGPNGPSLQATGGVTLRTNEPSQPTGLLHSTRYAPKVVQGSECSDETYRTVVDRVNNVMELHYRAVEEQAEAVNDPSGVSDAWTELIDSTGHKAFTIGGDGDPVAVGGDEGALTDRTPQLLRDYTIAYIQSLPMVNVDPVNHNVVELADGTTALVDNATITYLQDVPVVNIGSGVANLEEQLSSELALRALEAYESANAPSSEMEADVVLQEMHALMAEMHAELEALRRELAEISDDVKRSPLK